MLFSDQFQCIRDATPTAPLILVTTHADEGAHPLDQHELHGLIKEYGNIYSYVHISLVTNEGLSALKEEIARVSASLPYVHQRIPPKFMLVREELRRMSVEKDMFSIERSEYDRVIEEKVGCLRLVTIICVIFSICQFELNTVNGTRALELFKFWGDIYILSRGTIVLTPQKLGDVVSRVTSHSNVMKSASLAPRLGVLYHEPDTMISVWPDFESTLYPQFLDLLHDNYMAYLLKDKNGDLLNGYGVSIVPDMLTSGGSEKYELVMKESLFPEDVQELLTLRIRCNTIPAAFFSQLHCQCGFATIIGSTWKYGFAITSCKDRKNHAFTGSVESDVELRCSYALVALQRKHQAITLYCFGSNSSACSVVLQALISVRDRSFPFVEFVDVSVMESSADKGTGNSSVFADRVSSSPGAVIDAAEINMLLEKKGVITLDENNRNRGEYSESLPDISILRLDPSDSILDEQVLAMFSRSRTDSEDSMNTSVSGLLVQEDSGSNEEDLICSNTVNLNGDDILVSDELKYILDISEAQRNNNTSIRILSNSVYIDIQLAKCVREIMSYSISERRHGSRFSANALWVAFRTDERGQVTGALTHITLCPLTPSHMVGWGWKLLRESEMTVASTEIKILQSRVLEGLSTAVRQILGLILSPDEHFVLNEDSWIGIVDLNLISKRILDSEASGFERVLCPPTMNSVFMSAQGAQKLKRLPGCGSDRLLELATSTKNEGSVPMFFSETMDNEALYKVLYDFVNSEELQPMTLKSGNTLLERSKDEIISFDTAEEALISASESLMRRISNGFEKLKVINSAHIQRRLFPTTFVLVDSNLAKPSLVSLMSTKSYARQSAVRRYDPLKNYLFEVINNFLQDERYLLRSSRAGVSA